MSLFGEFLALHFGSEGGESTNDTLKQQYFAYSFLKIGRENWCFAGRCVRLQNSNEKGKTEKYKKYTLNCTASFCACTLTLGHDYRFKLWRAINWNIRLHRVVMKMCPNSYLIPFHRWLMDWLLSSFSVTVGRQDGAWPHVYECGSRQIQISHHCAKDYTFSPSSSVHSTVCIPRNVFSLIPPILRH